MNKVQSYKYFMKLSIYLLRSAFLMCKHFTYSFDPLFYSQFNSEPRSLLIFSMLPSSRLLTRAKCSGERKNLVSLLFFPSSSFRSFRREKIKFEHQSNSTQIWDLYSSETYLFLSIPFTCLSLHLLGWSLLELEIFFHSKLSRGDFTTARQSGIGRNCCGLLILKAHFPSW